MPTGANKIGTIHTHAAYHPEGYNETFSGRENGESGDIPSYDRSGLAFSFLISNGGYIKVLMGGRTHVVKELSQSMAIDPARK